MAGGGSSKGGRGEGHEGAEGGVVNTQANETSGANGIKGGGSSRKRGRKSQKSSIRRIQRVGSLKSPQKGPQQEGSQQEGSQEGGGDDAIAADRKRRQRRKAPPLYPTLCIMYIDGGGELRCLGEEDNYLKFCSDVQTVGLHCGYNCFGIPSFCMQYLVCAVYVHIHIRSSSLASLLVPSRPFSVLRNTFL